MKKKTQTQKDELVDTLVGAEEVYHAIVEKVTSENDDVFYKELVLSMLKRDTKSHIIFTIYKNLDSKKLKHLRDFINQSHITTPYFDNEEVLMQFALLYPDLMREIHRSLIEFFREFIERFLTS